MNSKDIETLAGRDDLTTDELLRLAAARRAEAPPTERIERNGWTAEISHHIHTHGKWTASAWRTGTTYSGERVIFSDGTEAGTRAAVEAFLNDPPR